MEKVRLWPLWKFCFVLPLVIALNVIFIPATMASDVCTFVRVLGHVDLLKGGKNPAIIAKAQLGAEEGDGVQTKEASRAQLHFVDDTDMFIAPKSEIIIESYMYNPNRKLKVVSNIIQGLAHAMINLIDINNSGPTFLKTNTAIFSVRGTDLYILIGPNFTDLFVKNGKVVGSSLQTKKPSAEYLNLLRRVEVRACGGAGLVGFGTVVGGAAELGPQSACRFVAGLPPSEVIKLPLEYFDRLDKLMAAGLPDKLGGSNNPKQLLDMISPPSK
jgi:hypothetical protein